MTLLVLFVGCILFIAVGFLTEFLLKVQEMRRTQSTAQDMIQSAKNKETFLKQQTQSQVYEYAERLRTASGAKIEQLKKINHKNRNILNTLKNKHNKEVQYLNSQVAAGKNQLKKIQNLLEEKHKKNTQLSQKKDLAQKKYAEKLKAQYALDTRPLKETMEKKLTQTAMLHGSELAQKTAENFQKDLEKNTSDILDRVLCRFKRSYCPERGIGFVKFPNLKKMQTLIGPSRTHLDVLEKECGVDIVVDEPHLSLSVQGLDPVRRELGRASLKKLSKKRHLNSGLILSVIRQTKRELLKKIRKDGQRVCQDLKIKNTSQEVRNMLGALRYRYSFAQNQHFHCEEVAWLCGLLMAELNAGISKSRRAGLFHDIGKAMDHAKPGGHAMLGADFIALHGEDSSVVHAVRAHHHDVQPKSLLDFAVIAADAISGSRPGARRSTIDSYSQKVLSIEKIGKSFQGVKDIYIMNGGREARVMVDSSKVNDLQALDLSKKIARKIEEECSYPGWIKVIVVRKMEASQTIKTA